MAAADFFRVPTQGHPSTTLKPVKPITHPQLHRGRATFALLALGASVAHADLVGQWRGTDYTTGENWTSTPATGSIVATLSGPGSEPPTQVTDGYKAGTGAVDLAFGTRYFTVSAQDNPVAEATELTLVALVRPLSLGTSGGGFYNGSGLVSMELDGVTADWGLVWNGNRLCGAAPSVGTAERSVFSQVRPLDEPVVAMFSWSAATGVQQLHVNGRLVASQETGSTAPRRATAFALGAATSWGSNIFDGEISEVRLYNSNEAANAAAIASELLDTYIPGPVLDEAVLTPTGGRFVLLDTSTTQVNEGGTFDLELDFLPVDPANVTVSKSGNRTTITFTEDIEHGRINYSYDLTVPTNSGDKVFSGSMLSPILPLELPGPEGSVGVWGIREYSTGAAPLPPNASNLQTAILTITDEETPATQFTDGTAPVLNHSDPDTNGATSVGNFNNDFNILTNAEGGQDWIVVGKTQVTISSPGELHTFSIHSDDGFAMRVTGPGGGEFVSIGGDAQIDPGDWQTIFRDGGTGDSNSRGTYRFDSAGTYDILFLSWDGGSGGYYEVAWAPGTYLDDRDTNLWRLVGNDSDPSIPAFRERFTKNPPGVAGTNGHFGVRTYLDTGATNLASANTFLSTTTRSPEDGDGKTIDSQQPYLNHRDTNGGDFYFFPDDLPFPGDNPSVDENNVVTVAKGRISIPSAGPYTFIATSDDGMILRIKGTNGNPDPSIRRMTAQNLGARFEMSNPNEGFFDGAGSTTRFIVDLEAGEYDLEFVTVENGGGFTYELGGAAGEWPYTTRPPGGFQLIGVQGGTVIFPGLADPGWTVQTSLPFLTSVTAPSNGSIANAELRISHTQGLADTDPRWAELSLDPENRTTTWDVINFHDPENGGEGSFSPTNPFPLNTPGDDNDYAMLATGVLNITEAGTYHLGFQGDDGGYMIIRGHNGTTTPAFTQIVSTLHPNAAVLEEESIGSGVTNKLRVEVGTGNSRTLAAVDLEVGQYEIQTLVFEGGGGSWWEVIGGSAATAYNYPLLAKGSGGSETISNGLTLVAQSVIVPPADNFAISDLAISTIEGQTSVSFSFGSQDDATYTVEASTDLQNWTPFPGTINATPGGVTLFSGNLSAVGMNGEPKVFLRVRLNE